MHSSPAYVNTSDSVAMHLLMETAMVDSKGFEILPIEEVEELKRERASLQSRIEATRRKLALEMKLRDAAQSLNRLYSPKGRRESDDTMADGTPRSPKRTRKSLLGNRSSSNDVLDKTDDEYIASRRRCDEIAEELSSLEKRSEEVAKRILEHTAGILQFTHKGLKKNVRGDTLPRSPESMASINHRSVLHFDGLGDFDDRSLYKSPEFFEDNGGSRRADLEMFEQTEKHLDDVNNRIRDMVLQADPNQRISLPPQKVDGKVVQQSGSQIQAHLKYLGQALGSIEAAQSRTVEEAQRSAYDSEVQMEDMNLRLHDMLQKTNIVGQSPALISPDSRGKSLQSQRSFSNMVLDRLSQRVEHLVEQKEILSRQIQQQRELNSKSDAQREEQIMEMTEELSNAKRLHAQHEKEARSATNQIHLLMEQLDSARQESVLIDQKRQSEDRKMLQAEKNAKKKAEESLHQTQRTLQTERDSKRKLEENLKQLQGTLKTDKDSRSRAEESLKQLQATLRAEKDARSRAEESLSKMQGTLQAGNDAQRQVKEDIVQLQTSLQSEKEARRLADENILKLQGLLQQEKNAQRHADGTLTQLQETLQAEKDAARTLETQLSEVQGELDEAKIDKAQAEAEVEKCRNEIKDLEGNMVRLQTDLTVVRAELDGAYGTRAQRAADVMMNPAVQKEMDALNEKNRLLQNDTNLLLSEKDSLQNEKNSLQNEVNHLKTQGSGNAELEKKVETLQRELRDTIEDYEHMTKASIEFERDREQLEGLVDTLRERCEALEAQLSDEKVKWLGMKSPGINGPGSPGTTTSTMILKNEFKKMMRDTRAENMKALRVRLRFAD